MPKKSNSVNCKMANDKKILGILHMAMGFSSMLRIFKSGTNKKIINKKDEWIKILKSKNETDFDKRHEEFCNWGVKAIESRNGTGKKVSYGQIAKTLNVLLKVMVYYCRMPNEEEANRLIPLLHPAIDAQMIEYLCKKYRGNGAPKNIRIIASVKTKETYNQLRKLVKEEIINGRRFKGLHPVHWDDIKWLELNEKD